MYTFQPIPIDKAADSIQKRRIMRLNCLGSLYYFIKVALKRHRLTNKFHAQICSSLERSNMKYLLECPRDHFKTTMVSEGLPMWWALPMLQQDCDELAAAGCPDSFIKFLLTMHDPNARLLLVSENLQNAVKLGNRIRQHFQSNDRYRYLFPETLPTPKEIWAAYSLCVNRTDKAHGEGTFDFIGVGGALQSRHYDAIIQDDLIGRKAVESASIMDNTIEYHKLVVGAFEGNNDKDHTNRELIVGNRWSYSDLNSNIRETEPWFRIESHGALGGCCSVHPTDTPIFPEEFSAIKLAEIKHRLGTYNFSCQFLNDPSAPEDADFQESWLNYYSPVTLPDGVLGFVDGITYPDAPGKTVLHHEITNGVVIEDLIESNLNIALATDPSHGGNVTSSRSRHAIVVVGLSPSGNYYLLDYWAQQTSFDVYISQLYRLADKWRLRKIGIETVAAQRYLAYHINYRNTIEGRSLRIVELKGEVEAPDGSMSRKKEWRIRNVLQPIYERGQFWIQKNHQEFLREYTTFPHGKYCDLLDALAYIPQMLKGSISYDRHLMLLSKNRQMARAVNKAYSVM